MKSVRPVALTPTLSHRERGTDGAACCPHPSPLPQGEGARRCGLLPSPRPSPTGRGGQTVRHVALTPALSHRERETDDAACCPLPGPLPQGEGDRPPPALSPWERERGTSAHGAPDEVALVEGGGTRRNARHRFGGAGGIHQHKAGLVLSFRPYPLAFII